ncbi:MAG TPA: indolepyruvate ferredoxin oxidoreductase subunit alpha [Methanotrichaceae archaeon]|nr:indolepyruvate ferredoxin oxidoreductase subunit alpha [Methanotrichaceae archaeon]HQF16122.1 indolepyruvate ferredoxin oxidoreductase subunit alpha [Methanotrichaceae archaeon]HQJ28280.1 indolepyruvate ferredoxin oxidoreductase subunit alpha [Methanotrichaceae archaeon]
MKEYLLGNAAIARGILESGAGLVAGYPGTPSSEIIETLSPLAGQRRMHVEWSVNEKVALEVAIGASWANARSVATMKHVGLNVASDPFMTLAYLGVGAGLVVITADDPYCHSSQNEQDSRRYAQFAGVPCLEPADPQEAKDMTVYAFELSERLNLPVMLRPTTRVSHARSDVETGQLPALAASNAGFTRDPSCRVALPVHVRPLHKRLIAKQETIDKELSSAPWNRLVCRADTGIIASGISGLYAEEALKDLELDYSLLRIGTTPAPSGLLTEMLEHCRRILVVEELEPVLEDQVALLARKVRPDLDLHGKSLVPRAGELDLGLVRNSISALAGLPAREPIVIPEKDILPPRPPALCPGCSHRATYQAMIKAFGKDAVFPSDIGCYTMGVGMGTVETCLCMGASISVATGIRFGGDERPICCTLGDSTFLHSGLTGLLNAAYNGARLTVTILDNSTTAMTGHQPHPGTGRTATGQESCPVSLEDVARALGAGLVETVDPYDLDRAVEVFRKARDFSGLSVVIARQSCVISARRQGVRRQPLQVTDACVGCQVCLNFGCPAIEWTGETASINTLCTGCGVCAMVCPSGSIKEVVR